MTPADIRKWADSIRMLNPSADGLRECALLIALADVVEAGKSGPCRHDASHTGLTCPMCVALARVEALTP